MQYIVSIIVALILLCIYCSEKKKEKVALQNQMLMQELWQSRRVKAQEILDWLFEFREVEYCYYTEESDCLAYDLSAFTREDCNKIDNIVKNRLRQRLDLPLKKKERAIKHGVIVQNAYYTQYILKIEYSVLDVMK